MSARPTMCIAGMSAPLAMQVAISSSTELEDSCLTPEVPKQSPASCPVAGTALEAAGSVDVELTAREHTAPAARSAPTVPPAGKDAPGSLQEEDASQGTGIRQRSRRRLRPSEAQEAAQPGDGGLGDREPLIASAGGLLQVSLEQRPFKQWLERETVETRWHIDLARRELLVNNRRLCAANRVPPAPL